MYGKGINPIETESGISEIEALAKHHRVAVRSVCADYFMEMSLFRGRAGEQRQKQQELDWLLRRCQILGVQRVVLPFVDESRIETQADAENVTACLRVAASVSPGVEIHLETSLPPDDFARLLARLPQDQIRVTYDSGNSASLGYSVADEFRAYGPRIGSVHIKDRVLGGGTVPLGTGHVDFDALFSCLEHIGYAGDFVLQAARDTTPGGEVRLASRNRAFGEQFLHRA